MIAKLKSVNLIIGIVVGVLGTVATGTAIWTFFVSPYQLEAYAVSVEAPMPPNLRETLNELNQFSLGNIRKRYSRDPDFPVIQDETLEAAIPVFSKIIKDRLTWSLELKNKLNDQLTVITLRNGGRKTVGNVQLQMQYATQGSVILDCGVNNKW
jgi:hypothetical protein